LKSSGLSLYEKDAVSRQDPPRVLAKVGKEAKVGKCSVGLQNCNATQCCESAGLQCYQQNKWYAQCRESCTEGPDPTHWDGHHWECEELGSRTAGDAVVCSALGEDCRESKCCKEINTQCFAKNDDWATCKPDCQAGGPDLQDVNGDPWSCETLGPWTDGAKPWVESECAEEGEDCTEKKCCKSPGAQCYKQSDYWAQCKYDCAPGPVPDRSWEPDWSCEEVGRRTPGSGAMNVAPFGEWASTTCVEEGEDCKDSKCCLGMNKQCFEKNKDWAMCLDDCTEGPHPEDKNETWSCKPMGPRSINGLALKGSPSIFCWVLFQVTSYEKDIVKYQLDNNAGIFQCDGYAMLSTAEPTAIGKGPDGKDMVTLPVKKAEITTSQDGTAGNAKLFINCWDALLKDGQWRHFAWSIKVDPDAIIVPDRVRRHLQSHVLENVYVVNCNAFPSSPNFPMMYGSVEIYSWRAIDTYARNIGKCLKDMGMMLPKWGEDYFMTHCLDHIGVGRISDFVSVGDNVCSGGSCGDAAFSAFHPYKSVDEWKTCWDWTQGKAPA